MLYIASQKIFIFTTIKSNIMAGIDDDLMDGGSVSQKKDEQQFISRNEQTVAPLVSPPNDKGIDIVLRIVHYIIDAAVIVLSIYMMDMVKSYPLVFCVALIIWMAYRTLYFTRSKTIDIIIGLFLFAAATFFYIVAIVEDYHECTGRINGKERNNK